MKILHRNLIIGFAVLAGAICLCIAVCSLSSMQSSEESESIEPVIHEFMLLMANKDPEKAYTLFSTRFQEAKDLSDIENMLQGNNYLLFDGYESIEPTKFTFRTGVPLGKTAQVQGIVTYTDGFTGKFSATLDKQSTGWKLSNIYITIPPDKIDSP